MKKLFIASSVMVAALMFPTSSFAELRRVEIKTLGMD